ncbi:MAG: lipocalin family protein [Gemmatimonadota bacterium]|nr:lipocalin family protein [Gemmatimonadota bacterium]
MFLYAAMIFAMGWLAGQDTRGVLARPVAEVDLVRYAGLWHEVARLPNRFQERCIGGTTAEYALLPNGQIQVVNQCRTTDGMIRAEGRAKLARAGGPTSVLKVRFAPKWLSFLPMVWGDYWILDLTDDYRAALVGDPKGKTLWILSRTPVLDEDIFERMVATARAQGFAVDRLIRPPRANDSLAQ